MGAETSKSQSKRRRSGRRASTGSESWGRVQPRSSLLNALRTDSRVQLVSRNSERALQVVTLPHGTLMIDGNGGTGVQCVNAIWTVVAHKYGVVSFHNQYNYLAIKSGKTTLAHYPPGSPPGPETSFTLHVDSVSNSIYLESSQEHGFLGVLPDGRLNEAFWTGKDRIGEFSVRMMYQASLRNTSAFAPQKAMSPPGWVVGNDGGGSGGGGGGGAQKRPEAAFGSSLQAHHTPNEAYDLVATKEAKRRYKKKNEQQMLPGAFQPVVSNGGTADVGPKDDLSDFDDALFAKKEMEEQQQQLFIED